MALLYVDEHSASLNYGEVTSGETLKEGEFVVDEGDGTYGRFDPADDTLPQGIIVHHPGGDAIAAHDEDYMDYDDLWKYEEGENFYYQPLASVDQIRPRSLTDNDTDPEPSFDKGATVGIVTINDETEIVESGYTDDDDTEYSESGSGDFAPLGRVDKVPQEITKGVQPAFDQRIPVRLDADVFTA